jgi:hypothetical protein
MVHFLILWKTYYPSRQAPEGLEKEAFISTFRSEAALSEGYLIMASAVLWRQHLC